MFQKRTLIAMPYHLAICSLQRDATLPQWLDDSQEFYSVTKTADELSIVAVDTAIPHTLKNVQRGWRALMIKGPLDFALTGILSSLLEPLAREKISIFAISTFDTDYILIKEADFDRALIVLQTFYIIHQ